MVQPINPRIVDPSSPSPSVMMHNHNHNSSSSKDEKGNNNNNHNIINNDIINKNGDTPKSKSKRGGGGIGIGFGDKSNRFTFMNNLLMPLQVATQQYVPRIKNYLSTLSRRTQMILILIVCVFFVMIGLGKDGNYDDMMMSSSSIVSTSNNGNAISLSSSSQHQVLHPQERYKLFTIPTDFDYLRSPQGPKYTVLVTGAAGFVGMHTCLELKRLGHIPIGYDNINNYYSTSLKQSRIEELHKNSITFVKGDVCDRDLIKQTIEDNSIKRIIHLAAQAGVRYSLGHPLEYTKNNIDCTVHLLEMIVQLPGLTSEGPLVYASSSSVYGNNQKVPFQEKDPVEDPASLYAATKRSDELIAQTYWNLYNVSSIGLRFFTVYGPYGRPDMAPWLFTDKISNGQAIKVFNHGLSKRDFTYIDDIVQGVVNSLYPKLNSAELINLGNGRPIVLADFVQIVEKTVGITATKQNVGMQKGDVPVTYADITKAKHMLGYKPSTPIEEGIPKFVEWFRQHNASQYRMTS